MCRYAAAFLFGLSEQRVTPAAAGQKRTPPHFPIINPQCDYTPSIPESKPYRVPAEWRRRPAKTRRWKNPPSHHISCQRTVVMVAEVAEEAEGIGRRGGKDACQTCPGWFRPNNRPASSSHEHGSTPLQLQHRWSNIIIITAADGDGWNNY